MNKNRGKRLPLADVVIICRSSDIADSVRRRCNPLIGLIGFDAVVAAHFKNLDRSVKLGHRGVLTLKRLYALLAREVTVCACRR